MISVIRRALSQSHKFSSETSMSFSSVLKSDTPLRLKGKVAVVTASTDG